VKIEAVEEGPRNPVRVAGGGSVVAAAVADAAAPPTAGARVRRCDELEMGGKNTGRLGSGDDDPMLFDDLAQRLERVPLKFGELVEEEHTAVGQRHLAGCRRISSTQ
jgi:hypothetical protein